MESNYVISDLLKKGSMIYNDTWRYNESPVWFWCIGFLSRVSDFTNTPLYFWTRLPFILADYFVVFFIYQIAGLTIQNTRTKTFLCLLYLFSPITIWISSYQGQLDGAMMVFVLWSIYELLKDKNLKRWQTVFKSALLLGFSIIIKLIPLGLIPVFLLYIFMVAKRLGEDGKKILFNLFIFSLLSVLPLILVFLPYFSVVSGIVSHVLQYKTAWGIWGVSLIVRRLSEVDSTGLFLATSEFLKHQEISIVVIMFTVVIVAFWKKLDILNSVTAVFLAMTVFSPFLAPQYLYWIVPFWLIKRKGLFLFPFYNVFVFLFYISLFTEWQDPSFYNYWAFVFGIIDPRSLALNSFTFFSLIAYMIACCYGVVYYRSVLKTKTSLFS